MTIFASRVSAAALLVPGLYFRRTRLATVADVGFLALTQWLPSLWLALRSDLAPAQAALGWLMGMIAFLAVYELGYLANDAWDARRAEDGRARLASPPGAAFVVAFVLIRAAAWLAIGWWTGWLAEPVWLTGYAALVVAFALHNLVAPPEPRLASFLSLAVLRFLLPVIALLSADLLPAAIVAALLLYAYPRYLSYADSKKLLAMPGRRNAGFALVQLAMLSPLVVVLGYWLGSEELVVLLGWYIAVYTAAGAFGRSSGGR